MASCEQERGSQPTLPACWAGGREAQSQVEMGSLHKGVRSGPRLAFRDQASQVSLKGQLRKEVLSRGMRL